MEEMLIRAIKCRNKFPKEKTWQKVSETVVVSAQDPKWSLERRESSGHLVWRKESPSSKVRFRFDVEVLEFEKQPHEDIEYKKGSYSASNITSTIALCATCVAAVAVSVFLPWYLVDKALSRG